MLFNQQQQQPHLSQQVENFHYMLLLVRLTHANAEKKKKKEFVQKCQICICLWSGPLNLLNLLHSKCYNLHCNLENQLERICWCDFVASYQHEVLGTVRMEKDIV